MSVSAKPRWLWLDTEYNGFQGELISLALVDEAGREWYEVLACEEPVPWVAANVMPVLGKTPTTRKQLANSLGAWLQQYGAIHVLADWPEDFVHFCSALVTAPGERLTVPPLTMELLDLPVKALSATPHNALEDAKAMREAHMRTLVSGGVSNVLKQGRLNV